MENNYQNGSEFRNQGKSKRSMHRARRRKSGVDPRVLTDLHEMESVELEEAVRELDCFQALDDSSKNHHSYALSYLEGILMKWCEHVETQQREKETKTRAPASFAAAAAMGVAAPLKPKSFAAAVAPKQPNVWQKPPTIPKPVVTISPSAALIPFGSYRLGVNSTSSDLDLLALAPPSVHRSDFFTSLVLLLREDKCCYQVHPIPSAYTPVIKFALDCGNNKLLEIDLVFARVASATKLVAYQRQKAANPTARIDYHLDDTDLQGLDEEGVRSLNGARVSQMILESVPDISKFQTVLRAVKHWAVVNGIYSNVLGFLGGVNWAILVAWVCKKYPAVSAPATLRAFFDTFADWRWSAQNPVMLNDSVAEIPPITDVVKQTQAVWLPAWNPAKNVRDRVHVMPIITPAYPSMNSSYNVDTPHLRRIREELVRAAKFFRGRQQNGRNCYRLLFKPSSFFSQYKHFLRLDIKAETQQDFMEWFRFVESRLRVLISNLETPQVHTWAFARFFSVPKNPRGPKNFEKCFFIGLRFAHGVDSINIKHLAMDFLYKVNSWEGRKPTMNLTLERTTSKFIPKFVLDDLHGRSRTHYNKDGTERSVNSENTAPATDDEDDDSCNSVLPNETVVDIVSPNKKCRVVMAPKAG